MEDPCIFCKIARKEIAANEIVRTDDAVVFRDLDPKAPFHLLVVPTRHVLNLSDLVAHGAPSEIVSLLTLAAEVGREAGAGGYRVVINEGVQGGQTVFHLHLHVLAGRQMHWPPG